MPIGHTGMLLAYVYRYPRVWRDEDIIELLNFRTKSILAGDLNEKHPAWNSQASLLPQFEILGIIYEFELRNFGSTVSDPFQSRWRLDIVVNQNVRLLEVIDPDILDSSRTHCVLHSA
jgi:hypothetical protein